MDNPENASLAPIKAVVQVIGMRVTDKMVETAKSVLSPSQLSTLRSLQLAQQNPDRSTIGSTKSAAAH